MILDNYWPVSTLPFWGKVVETAMAHSYVALYKKQIICILFPSGFNVQIWEGVSFGLSPELPFLGLDGGYARLLVLLNLSAAFNSINHSSLYEVGNWE